MIGIGFYLINIIISVGNILIGGLDILFFVTSYYIFYPFLVVLFFPFTLVRILPSGFLHGVGYLNAFQVLTWLVFPPLSIGFTFWTWLTYRMAGSGSYNRTRSSSLLLGILGMFFGSMISGIFSLLAYAKQGELIQLPLGPTKGVVQPTVPSQKFCSRCGQAVILGMKFCTNCGTEVATTTK